jgi:hypothetical protein
MSHRAGWSWRLEEMGRPLADIRAGTLRGSSSSMRSQLLPHLLLAIALSLCAALPLLAAGCGDDDNIAVGDLGQDASVPKPDLTQHD